MANKNKVIFDILANTVKFEQGIEKTVDVTAVAAKAMKIAFVALSAVVVGATVAFAKFEKGMSDISTIIDNNKEDIKGIGTEILKLSKTIPKPVSELVASMYDIRSAGVSAANAIGTLKSAGKLAVVGLSTTKEATDILTTSMNTFRSEGKTATEISNILFKTVKYGKNTVSQLAQSFGSIAPLVKESGVNLIEFSAATAGLTALGIPASVAQTQIGAAIVSLQKPTADMRKAFKKLGYKDMKDLMNNSKNLGDAFGKIKGAADDMGVSLMKLTGRKEGANAITVIATSGAEIYTRALKDMEGGVDAVDEAFKRQSATLMAQKQFILNMINSVFINLGSKFQPALISIGSEIIKFFETIDGAITTHGKAITNAMKFVVDVALTAWSVIKNVGTVVADLFNIFGGYVIITVVAYAIKFLVDILNIITTVIKTVTSAFSDMLKDFGPIGTAIKVLVVSFIALKSIAIVPFIFTIIKATKLWAIAQWALNLAMKANLIGLIIAAVAALAVIVYDVIVNFNEWKLSFSSLINSIIIGWKKAKAIFAGDEASKALDEEIKALEKENELIAAQTEALKKRKEELKAKGVSSFEADKQAGEELDKGELNKLVKREQEKTRIKKEGNKTRSENDTAAKETVYAQNEKAYNKEKTLAETNFQEAMVKAGENDELKSQAKIAYQTRMQEIDAEYRLQNLEIEDEQKILDQERQTEFNQAQLDKKVEDGALEREVLANIKNQEYQKNLADEKKYLENKKKMGVIYAKAKQATDKFYNNQAVKGFDENSQHLTKMANSKNKTLAGIGKAAAIAKIIVDTPRAAMGAYSALAGIPIIGPALGIAAAAAAVAYGAEQVGRVKSSSYAIGTDYVPRDMTANIHQGEGIIPAKENQFLQSGKLALVSPDAVTNNDNSTGQTVNNYNTEVSFADANIYGDVDDNMSIKIADNIATQINEDRFAGFPAPSAQTS